MPSPDDRNERIYPPCPYRREHTQWAPPKAVLHFPGTAAFVCCAKRSDNGRLRMCGVTWLARLNEMLAHLSQR